MAKKIDVNGLDHYHDKVSAMLASEYSSSKTYAVGDYCFHAGTLYECTTAITTAENWTAGHWTAAKLAEDTSELKTALDGLLETHYPTDYAADVSASDLVVGTSALLTKVTATDNASGGIDVVNSSGSNGTIGFILDDLPYEQNKTIDFTVEVTDAKTPITIDLRSGMSDGTQGTSRKSFELGDDGKYHTDINLGVYNYSALGKLFLGYNLRYTQTTAVNIKLTAIEHGDAQKTYIDPDNIQDIDFENLSDNLKDAIAVVSGSKPTQYGGKQIATFNKGVAIGDSLTEGTFNYNEGGSNQYVSYTSFSYPAKLKQLCGVDLTNLGNGGYTSDEWWAAHENDDLSGYQFAIIQLGVNDAHEYSGWTQTSITAFTNIINKLITENNGIFVFVSTIIPATAYTGATFTEVSEGIAALVETINNDHVILLDMAQYGNVGDEVGYNNGHLSALGYERLALDYIGYISYIIAQNTTLFRNIQFIGTNHSYS